MKQPTLDSCIFMFKLEDKLYSVCMSMETREFTIFEGEGDTIGEVFPIPKSTLITADFAKSLLLKHLDKPQPKT